MMKGPLVRHLELFLPRQFGDTWDTPEYSVKYTAGPYIFWTSWKGLDVVDDEKKR
jgi:hypothetical protein